LVAEIVDRVESYQKHRTNDHYDNQSAIKLYNNPIFHARTKHIEIHHHYIQKQVQNGAMKITRVPSQDQIVDIFTKPQLGVHYFTSFTVSLDLYTPMI
jgi:hypothetical protein